MTYTCGMPRQRTGTEFVSCTELMRKQANTTSAFNGSYPSHFCIQNYHSALASNFFSNLHKPFFLETVRSGNRHNQRNQNEFHAFIRSLIFNGQFQPCTNDNFFCSKRYVAKESFWKLFSNGKPYLPCYLLNLAK